MHRAISALVLVAASACATAPITGRTLEEREDQRRAQDRAELGAAAAGAGAFVGAGAVAAGASLLVAPIPEGSTQQRRSDTMALLIMPGAALLVGGIGVAAMTASAFASQPD